MQTPTVTGIPQEVSTKAHAKLSCLQNLLSMLDTHLRDTGADGTVLADVESARVMVQTTILALTHAEHEPRSQTTDAEPDTYIEAGSYPEPPMPPTPVAIQALGTLRAAAHAYTQWDRERGIVYGLGNVLTEYATAARDEVFGPSDP